MHHAPLNVLLDLVEKKLAEGEEDKLVDYALTYLHHHKNEMVAGEALRPSPSVNAAIERILQHLEAVPARRAQFEQLALAFKEVRAIEGEY